MERTNDGINPIVEYSPNGSILARYVYANGVHIAKISGADTNWYHCDALGSPRKMTNESGSVSWSATCYPFGEMTAGSGNTHGFTGKEYDSEMGLNYFCQRYYDPQIGRFMSLDPQDSPTSSPYAYCANNPFRFADPTGAAMHFPDARGGDGGGYDRDWWARYNMMKMWEMYDIIAAQREFNTIYKAKTDAAKENVKITVTHVEEAEAWLASNSQLFRDILDKLKFDYETLPLEGDACGNPFADNWLVSVKDALNQTTTYTYNAANYLTSISADGGYTRTYHYNTKYFMDYEISPERGQTNYSYDNAGNLIQRTDANGNLTIYTYDNVNRLTNVDYPGTSYDVNYRFDKADNCTLMTTPTNTCSLFYDPLNRLTKKKILIDTYAYTDSFTYDSRGNIIRITYLGDWYCDFTYDSENRVLTVPGFIDSNITYHPSGKEAIFTTTNGRTTTCTYNNRYWTSNITVNGGVMNESYQYDPGGSLMTLTDNLNSANDQSFTYDDIDRLKTFNGPWGNGTYNYATGYAIGRRYQEIIGANMTTYNYHSITHRLASTTGADQFSFAYDNNGNLTNIRGKLLLTYDYENRPVSINNLELRPTDFVYDAKGERVKKVLGEFTPIVNQQPTRRQEVYYYLTGLHGEVLCEIESFGQTKIYYVYLNGKKLCKVRGTNKYFYHNDYLGSTKAMTDNSGTKVYSWLGYPFGRQYSITGAGYNNYRFTGKEYDASTGLYYFGARYYMPEIGRFITPDPSGKFEKEEPKTINVYAYCTDNPLRYVDPTGKWRTTDNRYAWPVTQDFANREFISSFSPIGQLATCYFRSTTGDMTLSTKDWVWGAVGVVSFVLPATKIAEVSSPLLKAIMNTMDVAFNFVTQEQLISMEPRRDRIIWGIAAKLGIASGDGTIDLKKHKTKFEDIVNFVEDVDKKYGTLPAEYQENYEEWFEIYKKETPWYEYD